MTELERKALLGDKEAQKECTEKGILLPCPFCSGYASIHTTDMISTIYAVCQKCRTRTIGFYSHETAIKVWNTRQAPPNIEFDCEQFKDKSKFIELPCKVGQDVWFYASTMKELCKAKIIKIEINYFTPDNPFWLTFEYYSNLIGKHEIFSRADLLFGKTVFLTKEEADQALKEIERE